MVRGAAIVAVVFAAALSRAQPRPAFSALPGGAVGIALPSSMLEESAIRKQLDSGLTTVFLIVARERGTKNSGAARVEIRYDLWDEVWIVRKIDVDRRIEKQRLPTFDALTKWWRNTTRLFVSAASRVTLDVELRVLPFSAAEEKDARDWMASASAGGGGIVDALIGTTIAARPITTYRWSIDVMLR